MRVRPGGRVTFPVLGGSERVVRESPDDALGTHSAAMSCNTAIRVRTGTPVPPLPM